jgi:hypothetical protein
MRRRLKFEKEQTGWYAVIPEWTGPKADLEMVCGADVWLDILCQGEWHVWMTISDNPFDGAEKLIMTELGRIHGPEYGTGAWYRAETYIDIEYNLDMWLCDVTKFVFEDFPKVIYYKS